MASEVCRVMILEDEPPILEQLRDIVEGEAEGCSVVAAAYNGQDGLALLAEHRPDIVLCDIRMPLMDGLAFLRRVREMPLSPEPRVIILSGYHEFEYARTAVQLHAVDYLLKPVEEDKLLLLLQEQREAVMREREACRRQYLASCLSGEAAGASPWFACAHFWPVLVHVGSIHSHAYEAATPGVDWPEGLGIGVAETLPDGMMWCFEGRYHNQRVCVVHTDRADTVFAETLADRLAALFPAGSAPVSIVIETPVQDPTRLGGCVNNLIVLLASAAAYGENNLLFSWQSAPRDMEPLSTASRAGMQSLGAQRDYRAFAEVLDLALTHWTRQHYTQYRLQAELSELAHQLDIRFPDRPGALDAGSLLARSNGYAALRENLLMQVKLLFAGDAGESQLPLSELVDVIERYLQRHYAENITGKALGDRFGYNEVYITSVFKREKGVSPRRYVLDLRMRRACEMIAEHPDIRIKTVAEQVGYQDQMHFSRQFREYVGQSPSEYAESVSRRTESEKRP